MGIIRAYRGISPTIGDSVFVAETAAIIGDVHIGARSSVWYGTVIRGDVFHIRIGAECSIQDNTVIHVTSGLHATIIGDKVTVGHGAILHGCTVGDRCIIGMGATLMDQAVVPPNSMIGAGSLVTPGTQLPEGYLSLGSPARPKRKLSPGEIAFLDASAAHYVTISASYLEDSEAQ
jgi:carbonic anhydrase/acetyltransferase-like protein (isoleucine patch superfamily)